MSTGMLEVICEVSQSNQSVNRRGALYNILNSMKQRQLELKEALKATQNMR